MNVLFVCTDNFTRSVIAEYCMKNYILKAGLEDYSVSSAGIRANSDISKYSDVHFDIMNEVGIDTTGFQRMMLDEECFMNFDVIVGMSNLHVQYIKENFGRDIFLFNELVDGTQTPVQVGTPDSEGFRDQMKELVEYIHTSIPKLIENIGKQ